MLPKLLKIWGVNRKLPSCLKTFRQSNLHYSHKVNCTLIWESLLITFLITHESCLIGDQLLLWVMCETLIQKTVMFVSWGSALWSSVQIFMLLPYSKSRFWKIPFGASGWIRVLARRTLSDSPGACQSQKSVSQPVPWTTQAQGPRGPGLAFPTVRHCPSAPLVVGTDFQGCVLDKQLLMYLLRLLNPHWGPRLPFGEEGPEECGQIYMEFFLFTQQAELRLSPFPWCFPSRDVLSLVYMGTHVIMSKELQRFIM